MEIAFELARGKNSDWGTIKSLKEEQHKNADVRPFTKDVDDMLLRLKDHVLIFDFCVIADLEWGNEPLDRKVFLLWNAIHWFFVSGLYMDPTHPIRWGLNIEDTALARSGANELNPPKKAIAY